MLDGGANADLPRREFFTHSRNRDTWSSFINPRTRTLGMQRVILLSGRGPVVRNSKVPFEYVRRYGNPSKKFTIPVILAASVLGAGTSFADISSDGWGRSWNARVTHYGQPYDNTLSREWESQLAAGFPTLSSTNIAPLKAAIKRYQAIAAAGGWRPVPMMKLRPGVRHSSVVFLRQRLEMTGDLSPGRGYSKSYDYYVTEAVRRFQTRHGLKSTGVVGKSTVLALNVTARSRLRQLKVNLNRLRSLSSSAAKKYVVVNIPAAQIEAVENDQVVSRHAAVVGKVDRRTPLLKSRIHEVNFNPYWHVPQSIVRKDLVPQARQYARRGRDILTEYRIDAYAGNRKLDPKRIDWNSSAVYSYAYRQQPWEENSLGFVKINFHNPHSVYMHDTPSKSLFNRNFRAQSSGCVRVQNVTQLVSWLLQPNGWDISSVAQMKQTGERKNVSLKRNVPVYFVYVTAWATKDGRVNFRRDLYGRDGVGATASAY